MMRCLLWFDRIFGNMPTHNTVITSLAYDGRVLLLSRTYWCVNILFRLVRAHLSLQQLKQKNRDISENKQNTNIFLMA